MNKQQYIEYLHQQGFKTTIRTLNSWIEENKLRGISKDGDEIDIKPYALPPYLSRKSVKGEGFYKSIINGVLKGYDVYAELYPCDKETFNSRAVDLVQAGFLQIEKHDDLQYLAMTLKTSSFSPSLLKKALENIKVSVNFNIGINIGK